MQNLIRYICSIFFIISIMAAQKVSLSGIVSDTKEGTPLVGTNVYLVGTSLGTTTNEEGFYTIKGIKKGSYVVKVTYIGY
jgi:iron complex outermembrane receptor protein